jgi:gamma-glutamyltranspeptidase/glutathione hydrolase
METTHYSIIDQFGNAVSATTTLNAGYGSKYYCDELGFMLNNEMDDFSSKPASLICLGL